LKRKRKSKFDDTFSFEMINGTKVAFCKLCTMKETRIKMTNNNTTGLKRHLQSHHKEACNALGLEELRRNQVRFKIKLKNNFLGFSL
jgi:hypothetical protein